MAHPLWPLFDLRLRTERVELRLPTDDERAGTVSRPVRAERVTGYDD